MANNVTPSTTYTHRGDFLAEMYQNILLAIFDKTKDTSTPNKATNNSVIQEYKSTMEYYEKLEGPIFEPITVKNALIQQDLPPDVKTFLSEEWKKLNEKGQHQCPFMKDKIRCSTTFSAHPANLLQHYQKMHTTTPQFKCKICPDNFGAKRSAEDHVMIDHMFLKPYICEECDLECSSKRALDTHQRTVHLVPPKNSILYAEDKKNKRLKVSVFSGDEGKGGALKTQLYMIVWFHKVTRKIMGISFEYTSLKDVKLAATRLRYNNIKGANVLAEGVIVEKQGCSYVDEINKGWDFNPDNAIETGIYGDDEAAGKTLKFGTKLVTNAVGHDKTRRSLEFIKNCETEFFEAIRKLLPQMPEANQQFFNDEQWTFEKKYKLEVESGDEATPQKVRREI